MQALLITKVSEAKDAFSLVLKDSTGAYSGTNIGGLGLPNTPVTSGITESFLYITAYGGTTTYTIEVSTLNTLCTPVQLATQTVNATIANTQLGLSSTAIIPDYIYSIKYRIFFTNTGANTVSAVGANTITINVTNAAYNFQYIKVGSTVYTVESINGTTGVVTVTETVTASAGNSYTLGFEQDNMLILLVANGDKCVSQKWALVLASDCGCSNSTTDTAIVTAMRAMGYRYGAEAKFLNTSYPDCITNLNALGKLCDCDSTTSCCD